MSYRIRYERKQRGGLWLAAGLLFTVILGTLSAGEGLYDSLARYVGEMIRGAR